MTLRRAPPTPASSSSAPSPASPPAPRPLPRPAGTALFATLAKTYSTPFNLIVVGHLTLSGGEPFPAGALDLFVQPVLAFQL